MAPEGLKKALVGDRYQPLLSVGMEYSIFTLNFQRSASHEEIAAAVCHVIKTNICFRPYLVVKLPHQSLLRPKALYDKICDITQVPPGFQVILVVDEETFFFHPNQEGRLRLMGMQQKGRMYANDVMRDFFTRGIRGAVFNPYPDLPSIMRHSVLLHARTTPLRKRMTPERLAKIFQWKKDVKEVDRFLAGDLEVFNPVVLLSIGTKKCLPELVPYLSLIAVYVHPELLTHFPEALTTEAIRLCMSESEDLKLVVALQKRPRTPKVGEYTDHIDWLAYHPHLVLMMKVADDGGKAVFKANSADHVRLYRDYMNGNPKRLLAAC